MSAAPVAGPSHTTTPAAAGEDLRARAFLARTNPAAKVVAAVITTVALLPVLDPVGSAVVLAAGLALLPFSGVRARVLLVVGGPFLLMGASIGLVNWLFGEGGALLALGAAVRLMAIALPGVLVAMTSDPTDLADALVQRLRLPERPAMGVLAAFRLIPLLTAQWRMLTLARRARGMEAGRNPAAAVAIFAGKSFALLVRSIRTGTMLAMAMDARGFGNGARSHARVSAWRTADTWFLSGTVVLLCAAHALGIAAGTWQPLFA